MSEDIVQTELALERAELEIARYKSISRRRWRRRWKISMHGLENGGTGGIHQKEGLDLRPAKAAVFRAREAGLLK